MEVVIIGGGISGLSAAYALTQRGRCVRVLERAPQCGGVIQTEHVDGFVIDAGPDTLLVHKPAAIALCRDLGLEERFVQPGTPRTVYLLRRNRLRPLPPAPVLGFPTSRRALITTPAFSWLGKARMAAEILMPTRRPAALDESIASFVGRRLGRHAVRYLAEPLLAGIHSGDATRLSMQALYPQFAAAEQAHGSLTRAFAREPAGARRSNSVSLRGGLMELVNRLVEALPRDTILTQAEVQRIRHGPAFAVTLTDGGVVRGRTLILATPAYVTAGLVEPLDGTLARLCRKITHASTVTVALGYARSAVRQPLQGWGFVAPRGEGLDVTAATWVSSKWPARAAPDRVLLRAHLGGQHDSAIGEQPDSALVAIVERDLQKLFGICEPPLLARVYRWPRTIPQLEVGHLDRMTEIDRRLSNVPGLFVTAAGFRGVGIADCVADAHAVAQAADRHLAVSAPRARHRGEAIRH